AMSQVEGTGSLAIMRAVNWHNVLVTLGLDVPLVITHDLGCLVAGLGTPALVVTGLGNLAVLDAWRLLLVEFAQTDIVRTHGAWKHRDAMVGVVVARVLGSVMLRVPAVHRGGSPLPLPTDALVYGRLDARVAFGRYEQVAAAAWMETMTLHRLIPLLEIEQIDVDTLRLLSLFRQGGVGMRGEDFADLYKVIGDVGLSDIVDFSLELVPSLLEVRRDSGQQTFGIDGYAAIERVGHLDNLVLSQLAYDEDVFLRKLVDRELFYYTHEKQFESERRVHHILIDGSASMRGVREVFARGLALAMCKRLTVLGEESVVRFFDSRVYEGVRAGPMGNEVPYVLNFRSERGRNYGAVSRQLVSEFTAPSRRDQRPLVYLLTHGECQMPREVVMTLAERAPIHGIFILPRHELRLDYLDLIHRTDVIDERGLGFGERAQTARGIIDAVEREV
ncbi:MAG: hypothetical protein ACPHRO_12505, partial [Nannocystaceae bacterium]